MLKIKNYVRVQSLEEAYDLCQKKNNVVLGGMLWLKMQRRSIGTAIDLGDLGLDQIEEDGDFYRLGAMVSLRTMERHHGLNELTQGAMEESLRHIVGVQFRNGATVGGSLWRRMGFSDVLTLFMAMDSYVELYKGGIVALEEFASMKSDNDILVRLIIKKRPGAFAYQAVRKQRTDLPSLNCVAAKVGDEYRVVIGSRPARAMVLRDEKGILTGGIVQESTAAFADYAANNVAVAGNMWGSAEYRKALLAVLTRRALTALGEAL